jgi:hypothetical protein
MLARQPIAEKVTRVAEGPLLWAAAGAALILNLAAFAPGEAAAKPRQQPVAGLSLPASAPFPLSRPGLPATNQKDAARSERPAAASPACLKTLAGLALVLPRPPIVGPNGCGAPDAVRLEAVFTRSGRQVALQPAAELRCGMAEAVVRWVREDVIPALRIEDAPLTAIATAASYDCRTRNHVAGALISEHGLANALDIRALRLADGSVLDLTDRAVSRPLRELLRASACDRFSTVLGPGSDGYHEDHIHLDLRERRGGYKLCRWDVLDTVPAVAQAPSIPPAAPRAQNLATKPENPETKPLPIVRRGREAVARMPVAARLVSAITLAAAAPMPPPRPKEIRAATSTKPVRLRQADQAKRSRPNQAGPATRQRRKGLARGAAPDPLRDVKQLFQF